MGIPQLHVRHGATQRQIRFRYTIFVGGVSLFEGFIRGVSCVRHGVLLAFRQVEHNSPADPIRPIEISEKAA